MKLRAILGKIPPRSRRGKLIRNGLCAVLLAAAGYIAFGAPSLSARQAFRRAERSMLTAPTEIAAVVEKMEVDTDMLPERLKEFLPDLYDVRSLTEHLKNAVGTLVVGERGELVAYLCDQGGNDSFCGLGEKKNGTAVIRIYSEHWSRRDGGVDLPPFIASVVVLVVTDLPDARYASLEWRGFTDRYGEEEKVFYASLCRGTDTVRENGVFVIPAFLTDGPTEDRTGIEGRFDAAEAHLVLTDEFGNVIYDEILIMKE